jgi:hypothetical protein
MIHLHLNEEVHLQERGREKTKKKCTRGLHNAMCRLFGSRCAYQVVKFLSSVCCDAASDLLDQQTELLSSRKFIESLSKSNRAAND